MKTIILTGGGTAGHVAPNLALIPSLYALGYKVVYIGSRAGMEKKLVEDAGIPYYGISSGKLRRYLDKKNFTDMFRVVKGFSEAKDIIKETKPDVIFSKGGFVTVPVVIAGRLSGVPVVIHESDMTPGLANRIAMPFASAVCVTFPETLKHVSGNKAFMTGTPIRPLLFQGSKPEGLRLCGFTNARPVIMIMGGSQGSAILNENLRLALEELLADFQIIHICGKGNLDQGLRLAGYRQFEYVSRELPDLMAAADLIISRAGANSISEFLALRKPSLLIPLSKKASRGDQILNAASFADQGYARVLEEEQLEPKRLTAEIKGLYRGRGLFIENMKKSKAADGVAEVTRIILKYTKEEKTP